jgi:hypothetical protein
MGFNAVKDSTTNAVVFLDPKENSSTTKTSNKKSSSILLLWTTTKEVYFAHYGFVAGREVPR